LADALARHGHSPLIVQTASGKFHALFQHNHERRSIRPFKEQGLPIDVLGAGLCIAPPSIATKGQYKVIEGSLDDLDRLPVMRGLDPRLYARTPPPRLRGAQQATVEFGTRNDALFRKCMKEARYCDNFDDLLDVARTRNEQFSPPLPDDEVLKIVKSAWRYQVCGLNRFGTPGVYFGADEANALIRSDQDGFVLLAFLRANNGPNRTFVVANALHETLGWTRKRLSAARKRLEQDHLWQVKSPSTYTGAASYRWKHKGG